MESPIFTGLVSHFSESRVAQLRLRDGRLRSGWSLRGRPSISWGISIFLEIIPIFKRLYNVIQCYTCIYIYILLIYFIIYIYTFNTYIYIYIYIWRKVWLDNNRVPSGVIKRGWLEKPLCWEVYSWKHHL